MEIRRITVHNFRGVLDAKIALHDYSLLVGPNNAGKSTVIDAIREQNERLQHTTTIYLHPSIARFAKLLASTFPAGSDLGVCYFTNSGSEANEMAMLLARLHTGNFDIIALRNAYHGLANQTMGLTGLSTWK